VICEPGSLRGGAVDAATKRPTDQRARGGVVGYVGATPQQIERWTPSGEQKVELPAGAVVTEKDRAAAERRAAAETQGAPAPTPTRRNPRAYQADTPAGTARRLLARQPQRRTRRPAHLRTARRRRSRTTRAKTSCAMQASVL
jgi:hypothetical protein